MGACRYLQCTIFCVNNVTLNEPAAALGKGKLQAMFRNILKSLTPRATPVHQNPRLSLRRQTSDNPQYGSHRPCFMFEGQQH